MVIQTSNQHKIKEYQAFGIEAVEGPDLLEVEGSIDEVIIYKIMEVVANTLVEDTVLVIDGNEIVDAKYRIKEIGETADALWVTSLGYHDDINLYVYRGTIKGRIVPAVFEHKISFEPCFIPDGAEITLYELRQMGMKDEFSARRLAIEAFRSNDPIICRPMLDIPKWEGRYQSKI